MIAMMMMYQVTSEYSTGTIVFGRVLPILRLKTFIAILLSSQVLFASYLVSIVGTQLVFAYFKDIPIGDLMYPMRVFSKSSVYISTWYVLLQLVSIFWVKCMVFVSIAFAMSNVIKRSQTSVIIFAFTIFCMAVCMVYIPQLQSEWNPLYVDNFGQIIGRYDAIVNDKGYVLGYYGIASNNKWWSMLLYVVMSVSLLVVSYKKFSSNQRKHTNDKVQMLTEDAMLHSNIWRLKFELAKLNSVFHYKYIIGLMLILTTLFLIFLFFNDHNMTQKFQFTYDPRQIESGIAWGKEIMEEIERNTQH